MTPTQVNECSPQCCYSCKDRSAHTGCAFVYVPICCYCKTEYDDLNAPRKRKDEKLLDQIIDNLTEYKEIVAENEVWSSIPDYKLNPAELDLKARQKSEWALLNTTEEIFYKL